MNIENIEEIVLMLGPDKKIVNDQIKKVFEGIKLNPDAAFETFIRNIQNQDIDMSSWLYGILNGVSLCFVPDSAALLQVLKEAKNDVTRKH